MKARPQAQRPPAQGPKRPAGTKPPEGENGAEARRLCLVGVKVDVALRREIDAYAEANGVSRSRAAGHYLVIARETIREREGVPYGRADELMEAVDGLRAARTAARISAFYPPEANAL